MLVPRIRTSRLELRGWKAGDLGAYAAINADPRVGEWLGGVIDARESERRLRAYVEHWRERGFGLWAVAERSGGQLVGRAGFMHWDDWTASEHDAEVGWTSAPDVWGRGYATEAAGAALEWARTQPDLRRIISITRPTNVRSRRVMEKLGLTYRGETVWRGHVQVWYGIELS